MSRRPSIAARLESSDDSGLTWHEEDSSPVLFELLGEVLRAAPANRDAPAVTIVPALVGGGAKVRVVDPQGRREGEALLPGVVWNDDVYNAAHKSDALVILTEWNEFRALDLKRMVRKMATPVLADLRNIYAPKDAKRAGFETYVSIGRTDFGVDLD